MSFVAITKHIKDVQTVDAVSKQLPDKYPVQCEEFETLEAAQAKYPNAEIMSAEAYSGYKAAFQHVFDQVTQPKPSIWSKLNPFKARK